MEKSEECKLSVCAGIVTYNPEIERFSNVLAAIVPQVDEVFVEDNGSSNLEEIKKITESYSTVEVLEEDKNRGIAHALKRLADVAIRCGYSWLLTLDHDTICDSGLIMSFQDLIRISNVGIICPRVNYVDLSVKEKGDTSKRYVDVPACMTSGSFMRLSAYKKTEGFDEWMFIDYVDNDICMKLKLAGYRIIRDNRVFMDHQLGKVSKKRILGREIVDLQYSSKRIYYITRNSIYFRRKYRKHINGLKYNAIILRRCLMFGITYWKDKEKIKAIKKGIYDGLTVSIK